MPPSYHSLPVTWQVSVCSHPRIAEEMWFIDCSWIVGDGAKGVSCIMHIPFICLITTHYVLIDVFTVNCGLLTSEEPSYL